MGGGREGCQEWTLNVVALKDTVGCPVKIFNRYEGRQLDIAAADDA